VRHCLSSKCNGPFKISVRFARHARRNENIRMEGDVTSGIASIRDWREKERKRREEIALSRGVGE